MTALQYFKSTATKLLLYTISLVVVVVFSFITLTSTSDAADLQNFRAGRIIDDAIFANNSSMTAAQIQNFLNAKGVNCTDGEAPCLKHYFENGRVAAQIIYDTAQQYRINPQTLIVLLQKETGLVTANQPGAWRYASATGYGCPDSNPGVCNANYRGFTNQLKWAGTMYRAIMDASPTWYTPYSVGNNQIYYHPDLGRCGSSLVNIENRATLALYSYTPYQPNQASLNAEYGVGDSCSTYGNRNFYHYFTDWFGSTTMNSTFLRTIDDNSLYLVSGGVKYPIADITLFNALYPLGGVGYVSQSYLDTKVTGQKLGRVIRSSNGTVYFYDAGIKLPFGSCAQVEAYGSSCGQSVLLEDYQINSLFNGPNMTDLFGTTSGKRFYISGGMKREVLDNESLSEAGISSGMNVLNESALVNLSYGTPVTRNNIFIRDRSNNSLYVHSTGASASFVSAQLQGSYLNNMNLPKLDKESIDKFTIVSETGGYLQAADGSKYIIVDSGKIKVTSPDDWSGSFSLLSNELLSQIPTVDTLAPPYTIKSQNSGTIYLLNTKVKRAITSWSDLLVLTPNLKILSIPDYYMNTTQQGGNILSPGGLVKSPNDATVYMVDGLDGKIAMTSFNPSSELGLNTLKTVSDEVLASYVTKGSRLSPGVQCDDRKGLAIGGSVYDLDLAYLSYTVFSDVNCRLLTWKTTPLFLLAQGGTIYQLKDSKKLPISSYGNYISLGGSSSNTISASDYILNNIETGPLL